MEARIGQRPSHLVFALQHEGADGLRSATLAAATGDCRPRASARATRSSVRVRTKRF
jgi:hypothetical protein